MKSSAGGSSNGLNTPVGGEAGLGSFCAGNEELDGNQNAKPWHLGMLTQVYTARGGTQVVP